MQTVQETDCTIAEIRGKQKKEEEKRHPSYLTVISRWNGYTAFSQGRGCQRDTHETYEGKEHEIS